MNKNMLLGFVIISCIGVIFAVIATDDSKSTEENTDDKDRTKFSSLEFERFRRVIDYMKNTNYDQDKVIHGMRNFYSWFSEYDKRRGTNLVETFPELEHFYKDCSNV